LRFSEATRLTLADVDLTENVLTICATKFYKSRLVPIGPQLATVLANYMPLRRRGRLAQGETSFLLANRDGTRLASSTVQAAFDALRRIAKSMARQAGDRSRACTISGTASRFTA
jgi:integrase